MLQNSPISTSNYKCREKSVSFLSGAKNGKIWCWWILTNMRVIENKFYNKLLKSIFITFASSSHFYLILKMPLFINDFFSVTISLLAPQLKRTLYILPQSWKCWTQSSKICWSSFDIQNNCKNTLNVIFENIHQKERSILAFSNRIPMFKSRESWIAVV